MLVMMLGIGCGALCDAAIRNRPSSVIPKYGTSASVSMTQCPSPMQSGSAGSSGAKVAISVAPSPSELRAFEDAGADLFQVHFPEDTALEAVRAWSEAVGPERLWLAPRLAPGMDVPAALLPLAGVFLMDAFSPDKFGGTGLTGDWGKFASHQAAHPEKGWVLSGGLGPDNIGRALAASGARWVDANSGVESAPGVKDRAKLTALAERIRDSQKK